MLNTKILKFSTLIAYTIMVGVNYLAVSLPLNNRDTGAISDDYQNLFSPAGYAFSIWGLIYILLGIYVAYQFSRQDDSLVTKINRIFIINALLNASWIFAWHYDQISLSVIIMLGLLITLIRIADLFRHQAITKKEQWLTRLPFSVYFGWITVATIANITVFLVSINWNGFGLSEVFWTVVILLAGVLIGVWRMLLDNFPPYGLVLIWAYGAILFKHLSESGFAGQYPSVILTTTLCIIIFLMTIGFIYANKNTKNWRNHFVTDRSATRQKVNLIE